MTRTARSLLIACGFEPADWEHFMTGMSDNGEGVFLYDSRTGALLRITCTAAGPVAVID